ncbi:hypothetical protein RRG08_004877 [Elysia crispata]|uniref:Uncharacterized protein n=1 Tax=Elysia crispata TaxID=231223 RepID=A0AAE1B7N2_9GAST|nr:hypothetical protein RRG08_004877 [Elysia crispata]
MKDNRCPDIALAGRPKGPMVDASSNRLCFESVDVCFTERSAFGDPSHLFSASTAGVAITSHMRRLHSTTTHVVQVDICNPKGSTVTRRIMTGNFSLPMVSIGM